MKHLSFILCALALAVPISIGVSACTEGTDGDFDPCQAWCDKVDECIGEYEEDCLDDCNENNSFKKCANDCDESDSCDDYFTCVFECSFEEDS